MQLAHNRVVIIKGRQEEHVRPAMRVSTSMDADFELTTTRDLPPEPWRESSVGWLPIGRTWKLADNYQAKRA